MRLTLVTGNQAKLAAWQRILPADFTLANLDLDLQEIQSFDSDAIVRHKLLQAYALVNGPTVVEDISAGLDHLNGLPGPFIKFFEQRLGQNALYKLAGSESPAAVICTIGYYDGQHEILAHGTVHGSVAPATGDNGFGFDFVFKPDGQHKRYSEMTHAEKDAISHRRLAIDDLVRQLKQL